MPPSKKKGFVKRLLHFGAIGADLAVSNIIRIFLQKYDNAGNVCTTTGDNHLSQSLFHDFIRIYENDLISSLRIKAKLWPRI